jgi:hypothetical protein
MKSKDVLLFASGFALGYLIFGAKLFRSPIVLRSPINKIEPILEAPNETVAEPISVPTECEKLWIEKASTMRFASNEAMESAKQTFLSNCTSS